MKSPILLPLFATLFILGTFAHAGESVSNTAPGKPIARRSAPVSPAASVAPVVRRDRRPQTPGYIEVRIARARVAATPWAPGAPGD